MSEFLLELRSEEIPARMQRRAADDIVRLISAALTAHRLSWRDARAFVTPRRLCVVVDGLPAVQPDLEEERRGPRAGAPERALTGFLRATGLTQNQLELRDTEKGTFYFATISQKGRPTAALLAEIVPQLIADFPWPKAMRWGAGSLRWIRPLHGILCIFDGAPVAFTVAGGPQAGAQTRGHRFMAPEDFTVENFADYQAKLLTAKVVLDATERRRLIEEGAGAIAERHGLELIDDPALLDEVAGLVEWPVVLVGRIGAAFLEIPSEALISAIRTHQKYFSLREPASGDFAPFFIVVADNETDDDGATIIAGNERVLNARLSDARFFWDNDRKMPLERRVPALKQVVFHARLGTLADKVARLESLAPQIAAAVPGADPDLVRTAANLCKADLTTEMVGEFPDLQGIMGRYYALGEGEKPEIADAIAEHYAPLGPSDQCPSQPVSVALALADKLDSLVGFFRIGEKPTGSRDPFALRRAAIGVIRLILENRLRLPLMAVFNWAEAGFQGQDPGGEDASEPGELLDFFEDRLKVHLREQGVRHDLIAAVFALGGEDDLVRLLARVTALETFLATDDGTNLLAGFRRANNIVRIEERRDKTRYDGEVRTDLLCEVAEKALAAELDAKTKRAGAALAAEDFTAAMAALAELRRPIDDFFEQVTVNDDNPELRSNRLKLLSKMRAALGAVADFSKIEG